MYWVPTWDLTPKMFVFYLELPNSFYSNALSYFLNLFYDYILVDVLRGHLNCCGSVSAVWFQGFGTPIGYGIILGKWVWECVWVIWDDTYMCVCNGLCMTMWVVSRFACGRVGGVGESVGVYSGTRRIIIEVKNNIVSKFKSVLKIN